MADNVVSPVAMAPDKCQLCGGSGQRQIYGRTVYDHHGTGHVVRQVRTCQCVRRKVFRACIARYREMRARGATAAWRPNIERVGTQRNLCTGFKGLEYTADLETTARRALGHDPLLWAVFVYHYLHNLPWRIAIAKVGLATGRPLDRGAFFHASYSVEEQLGQVWTELQPYTMWPRAYFSGWYADDDPIAAARKKRVFEQAERVHHTRQSWVPTGPWHDYPRREATEEKTNAVAA